MRKEHSGAAALIFVGKKGNKMNQGKKSMAISNEHVCQEGHLPITQRGRRWDDQKKSMSSCIKSMTPTILLPGS